MKANSTLSNVPRTPAEIMTTISTIDSALTRLLIALEEQRLTHINPDAEDPAECDALVAAMSATTWVRKARIALLNADKWVSDVLVDGKPIAGNFSAREVKAAGNA